MKGVRRTNAFNYDLIINTGQIGPDLTAEIIMHAARSDRMKTCSLAAAETMERLRMKKKSHAALIDRGSIFLK